MNAQAKIEGVPIDRAMIAEADARGIDVVRACESGLHAAIRRAADPRSAEEKRAAEAKWAEENRETMEAWNDWLDRNGMPFAEYRVI